jgi:hypothetical protein
MYETIEKINVSGSALNLLLDQDITALELEQIGQRLRSSEWINSLLCTTASTCLTATQ